MNDLLARINEFRRAQPEGMGDKEWFLSGRRVLLRRRPSWWDRTFSGIMVLFFVGLGVVFAPSDWELHRWGVLSGLGWLSVLLLCLWISFGHLVYRETLLELDWQQQVITRPRDRGMVTPLAEIECTVGESYVRGDEGDGGFCDPPYAVLRDGRSLSLPYLLEWRLPRRNTAAYGFLLDRPALYLNERQQLAALNLEQPMNYLPQPARIELSRIDLGRLWAVEAERLSPNAWRDEKENASQRASRNDGTG